MPDSRKKCRYFFFRPLTLREKRSDGPCNSDDGLIYIQRHAGRFVFRPVVILSYYYYYYHCYEDVSKYFFFIWWYPSRTPTHVYLLRCLFFRGARIIRFTALRASYSIFLRRTDKKIKQRVFVRRSRIVVRTTANGRRTHVQRKYRIRFGLRQYVIIILLQFKKTHTQAHRHTCTIPTFDFGSRDLRRRPPIKVRANGAVFGLNGTLDGRCRYTSEGL